MSIHFGTTKVTLNVRPGPSQNPVLFQLKPGDKVEASEIKDGWWKLSKVIRGSNTLALPAQACFAYEGENNGYITLDRTEDTPPTDPSPTPAYVFIQFDDGVGGLTPGDFYDLRKP